MKKFLVNPVTKVCNIKAARLVIKRYR